jgi:hypothetical protein
MVFSNFIFVIMVYVLRITMDWKGEQSNNFLRNSGICIKIRN